MRSLCVVALALSLAVLAIGCSDDEEGELIDLAPRIDNIQPSSATFGDEVLITGYGFDVSANDIGFSFNDSDVRYTAAYETRIPSPDGKTLRFTLEETLGACPETQTSGCDDVGLTVPTGDVQVSVHNANGTSNSLSFTRVESPIEAARLAVGESEELRQLQALLDPIVNSSYSSPLGRYLTSYSFGYRQSEDGEVYVEFSLTGAGFDDVLDQIPDEIAGYDVRVEVN
jgi:hypothetical protein